MREPLPLAARTAFDFLKGGGDAAGKTYDGAFRQAGEVETDAYLRRAYRDFAALTASGEFFVLAELLLRPLLEAIPAKAKSEAAHSERAAKADKTAGAAA
jgi:exodeoxyribonuclease V gamma subunit